jgi:type I restriction enzyme S subunit
MGSVMPDTSFDELPLDSLFRLSGKPVFPALEPGVEFHHHSLPAWDATGRPAIELGSKIESNKVLIDGPSVLVSKLNPRKPRVAVVEPRIGERHCASTEFMSFVPRAPKEDLRYWAYYLGSSNFSARLQRVAIGSTNSHTRASPSEVIRWTVPNPSDSEKSAIARVLGTLDTAIRQTETIIEKLKQVKQGLLHDLLTRGIDANGELRPLPIQAPHLYRASPLGQTPIGWNVDGFEAVVQEIDGIRPGPFGSSLTKNVFVRAGYRVYGQEQVLAQSLAIGSYFISMSKFQELKAFEVKEGDLLLTMVGVGTIGRVLLVRPPFEPGVINPRLLRLRLRRTVADPECLARLIQSPIVRRQFDRFHGGGTMPVLNLSVVKKIRLPIIPLTEQLRINEALKASEGRLESELGLAAKLRMERNGLADDLLTGRVRVTPLLA